MQDHVCWRDDIDEYIYHIGNARSRHALHHPGRIDSRRKKSQKGQAVSVFHSREPDVRQSRSGRRSIRSGQTQNCGVQEYVENSPEYSILVQSKARSKKRIAVLSNSIARIRSFSTHHFRFVLRKWYTWRLERIYTAKYFNHQGYRASYLRQIRNMDVRILSIPKQENPPTHKANKASSTGKLVAHFSRTHVASIPEKVSDGSTGKLVAVMLVRHTSLNRPERRLESQWNRQKTDSTDRGSPEQGLVNTGFRQDWRVQSVQRKVEGVDHQHRQHGILRALRDVFYDTMPWLRFMLWSGHYLLHMRQVHAAYREESTVEQGKIRRPVNSRLRYQKKKKHGARHGPSVRQTVYHKAHDMLRKARKHKSGGYKTTLKRWHDDGRKSLSDIGWTEEQIIQYGAIALEDHSYVATWQEISRNEKSWNISLNAEGIQGPLNMQKTVWRTYSNHWIWKQTYPSWKTRQRLDQPFEGFEEYDYRLDFVQDGDTIPLPRRIHLRHHDGNQAAAGSQIEAGIRGKHHPGLNSNFFFFFVQRCHFACRKFNLLAIDRGCRQTRLPRTTLSHAQSLHRLVLLVVRVYSHALTSMHLHGSRLKRIFVYHLKTLHPRRAMPYTLQNLTPRTSTPSTPFPEPVFQHSKHPCQDQRPQQRGALTETPPPTWNEGMYRDAFTAELKQASDTLARSSTMESTVSPPSVVKN